ncbi:MAG TPA: transporter associated domain-containing protein, partial [Streptosporangiaceae bacterium]|nr:transporter associated domain-containing protein [Streptosporangiaceae bacterium]
ELPEGPYETAAGYVLSALGALPSVGDTVQVAGRTIAVTELDGRRVARLRVTASVPSPPGQAQPGQAQPGQAQPAAPAGASSTVAAGQVGLDSEAPRE